MRRRRRSMRPTLWIFGAALLTGCDGENLRCDNPFDAYKDEDADGFGGEKIGLSCRLEDGQSKKPMDCDDTNPDIHPKADEVCDGVDNDCDGQLDNGMELKQWHQDLDADGFGTAYPSMLACE